MVNGHVETISPDATELPDTHERDRKDTREHVSRFPAVVFLQGAIHGTIVITTDRG